MPEPVPLRRALHAPQYFGGRGPGCSEGRHQAGYGTDEESCPEAAGPGERGHDYEPTRLCRGVDGRGEGADGHPDSPAQ